MKTFNFLPLLHTGKRSIFKPSGGHKVAPFFFLFLELETLNFGYLLIS